MKNFYIYLKHKIMDVVRVLYYSVFNERFKMNFSRFVLSRDKKSSYIVFSDFFGLWLCWGFFPMQYFTHDFYSKKCTLSFDEMKKYIPSYYFYKVFFPKWDNVNFATNILENKSVVFYLFKGLEYSSPSCVGFVRNGKVINTHGDTFNDMSFYERVNEIPSESIFIKPVTGRGGKGIIVFDKKKDMFFSDNSPLDLEFFKTLKGDFIIEEGIIQHEYLSTIYQHSVNTLRIVTANRNGLISIVAITLRMGTSGRRFDNGSLNGLLVGIDVKSGKSIKPYASLEYGLEKFYHHPDSGFEFKNLIIPNWDVIIKQFLHLANRINFIHLIGWDVAICDRGIVIIEANTLFGIDHSQSGCGGLKESFYI